MSKPAARAAAGFVLFAVVDGTPHYLLLRNALHGTWGFPKGHAEADETPLDTALRETAEETGIERLEVIPGFEVSDTYEVDVPRGRYRKTVFYFLARVAGPVHRPSDEHSASAWLPFEEALAQLEYPALRETLRRADAKARETLGG